MGEVCRDEEACKGRVGVVRWDWAVRGGELPHDGLMLVGDSGSMLV